MKEESNVPARVSGEDAASFLAREARKPGLSQEQYDAARKAELGWAVPLSQIMAGAPPPIEGGVIEKIDTDGTFIISSTTQPIKLPGK